MRFHREGVVSIWAGCFADEADLTDYVDWHYSVEDEDAEPFNAFAAHSGIGWFDHDFQEANFVGAPPENWRNILQTHSYGDSFADAAATQLTARRQIEWNSLFLLFDCDYQPEKAHPASMSRLHFVGKFGYKI